MPTGTICFGRDLTYATDHPISFRPLHRFASQKRTRGLIGFKFTSPVRICSGRTLLHSEHGLADNEKCQVSFNYSSDTPRTTRPFLGIPRPTASVVLEMGEQRGDGGQTTASPIISGSRKLATSLRSTCSPTVV